MLAGALVLTGCSSPLPEPAPGAVPAVPPPVLTLDQADHVLEQIGTDLAAADAALSAADLATRVSGPALASRTAEYAVSTTTAGAKGLTALEMNAQTLVLPSTEVWPRTQLVVTEQPDDLSSPRLLVLQQTDPRSQYTLWGWVRLLPGVKMPATAAPTIGSAPLAADADGLLAAPNDVVAHYADVLLNGDASPFVAEFAAPDPYRQGITSGREPFAQIASQTKGTFTETYTPDADQTFALATADGGAIVVAAMSTASSLSFSGASLPLPAEFAALSGGALAPGAALRSNLEVTYSDVIAFYVPPAGATTPVQVLGAEHIRTSVTGS
ncbi:hypothetical protein EUA98_12555 [Pengzhenrongella frigida]|uniref:DUF8094 domain-containing protein n=1 Tax=Pengzhenrongella frigida TaxID=1259133 RepID=A0A4Q5N0D4_9MICO|nr:hypothetical protein EUA98_12555 [Cellulomonas sp. HLT2-17]